MLVSCAWWIGQPLVPWLFGGMTQEFHRNHAARSDEIKTPEGIAQQILEILDRNFKRTPNSPVLTLSSHKLRAIEKDLAQLGIASWGCLSKEMLDRIRPRVFEALGFRLPPSQQGSDLQVVHTFVVLRPELIGQIFSKPSTAFTLGPVFVYPASFGCFKPSKDRQLLTEIAACLRKGAPHQSYQRWQEMQAQSLVMEYRGRQCSPSPNVYCAALRLPEKFISLSQAPCKHEALGRFVELIQSGDSIPQKLWGVLSPEARDQISSQLQVADVVSWMNKRFGSVRMQAEACKEMCDRLDGLSTASDEEDIEMSFAACRQNLIEVCDFAHIYFKYKLGHLKDDPISDLMISTGSFDTEEWAENPAEYHDKKLKEYLQEKLQGELAQAMYALCSCMSHQLLELPCTFELARSIDSLQDVLDLSLDGEESGEVVSDQEGEGVFSYIRDLLPCFDRAIDGGNFEAARAVRLLFPRNCVRDISNRLSLIDDHIDSQQGLIIRSMLWEGKKIAKALEQVARPDVDMLPRELEHRIENFRQAVDLVVPQKSKSAVDSDLFSAVMPIVLGLLEWDIARQAAGRRGVRGSPQSPLSYTFYGCRKTAEILGSLDSSPGAQRSILYSLIATDAERYGAIISDFIASSNRNLAQSMQRVVAHDESLRDILPDFDAACGAERIYDAAGGYRERLPAPIAHLLPRPVMLGRAVLKIQEDLRTSSHGYPNIRARDLACIEFWVRRDVTNPERQYTLRRLFDVLKEGKGVLPKEYMPLVFESVTQYARDFRAAMHANSLGETEFQHGVAYILGGFLTLSVHITVEQRLDMARVLRDVFNSEYSVGFSPDRQHRQKVASAFDALVHDSETTSAEKALRQFSKRPEIKQLLTQLGLV